MKKRIVGACLILVMLLVACSSSEPSNTMDFIVHVQLSPVHVVVDEITGVTPSVTKIPVTVTPTKTLTPIPSPTYTKTPSPTVVITPPTSTVVVVTPSNALRSVYVDGSSGSDTNSGLDIGHPYKTIQKAVNGASPGDVIYVRGGTYVENIVITKSGTVDNKIVLTNFNDESVMVDGGSSIAIRFGSGTAYWILLNIGARSTNRYTLRLGWWGENATHDLHVIGCELYGANVMLGHDNSFENNNISGVGYIARSGDAGVMEISTSHHNKIVGNTIHDFTSYNSRGIWTQGLTHNTLIENNHVYNIMASSGLGQCIDVDGAGNVEWEHVVRGNIVENCSYVGIQLENAFATVVDSNTILGDGNAGIIVISYDSDTGCKVGGDDGQYGSATNCKGIPTYNVISNNTLTNEAFWSYGYGGIVIWYSAYVTISNNIITAAQFNASYPAINVMGSAEEVAGTTLENNTVVTK